MSCCSIPCSSTDRFFSRLAGYYRWRFTVFGFEKSQKQLLRGVEEAGIDGASLLEIGCGVGHLHRSLLDAGAARATGVDLSRGMLTEAERLSRAAGVQERTEYHLGDFVDLADTIEEADITILDKVVCCYPDPERLLDAASSRTRRALALTYPRDRRLTRAGVSAMAGLMKLLGSAFRPYVHAPEEIRRWITSRGFSRRTMEMDLAWQTEVYLRG